MLENGLTDYVKVYMPSVEVCGALDIKLIAMHPSKAFYDVNATRALTRAFTTQTELTSLFGGATLEFGIGSWYSQERDKVVFEVVYTIKSYCNHEQLESKIDEVLSICKSICSDFSQEAVSLEVNNKLYFIS